MTCKWLLYPGIVIICELVVRNHKRSGLKVGAAVYGMMFAGKISRGFM